MSSINEKLDYLNETKQLIRSSLVQRGQVVDDSTPFRDYASKILNIDTQSDFIDNRTVINDFTYQNDGYYKDMPNPDDYKVNTTVLCIGNLYSAENILEQTAFVIYQIMSVSDGNAHCKVVDILDEYNVGDIKLFETEEEMNSDSSAKEGDLAVVYREDIQNMTVDTQTQYITFPETVVLPEAFTGDVYCMLRAVDSSVMFDAQVRLSATSFRFSGFADTGRIDVQYTSSDGINYTRSTEITNPVDLGTTVQVYSQEEWNNNMGYFMQIPINIFDGLYQYFKNHISDTNFALLPISGVNIAEKTYTGTPVGNYNKNDIAELMKKIKNELGIIDLHIPFNIGTMNGKLIVTTFISDDKSFANFNEICYDKTNEQYQIYSNWSYSGNIYVYELNLVEYTYTLLQTIKKGSSPFIDVSGKLDSLFVNASIDENNDVWVSDNAQTYIRTSESGEESDMVNLSNSEDIKVNLYIIESKYLYAKTQFTLQGSNQLLPNIIAYGKNGNVTGDGSIYNNIKNIDFKKNWLYNTDFKNRISYKNGKLVNWQTFTKQSYLVNDELEIPIQEDDCITYTNISSSLEYNIPGYDISSKTYNKTRSYYDNHNDINYYITVWYNIDSSNSRISNIGFYVINLNTHQVDYKAEYNTSWKPVHNSYSATSYETGDISSVGYDFDTNTLYILTDRHKNTGSMKFAPINIASLTSTGEFNITYNNVSIGPNSSSYYKMTNYTSYRWDNINKSWSFEYESWASSSSTTTKFIGKIDINSKWEELINNGTNLLEINVIPYRNLGPFIHVSAKTASNDTEYYMYNTKTKTRLDLNMPTNRQGFNIYSCYNGYIIASAINVDGALCLYKINQETNEHTELPIKTQLNEIVPVIYCILNDEPTIFVGDSVGSAGRIFNEEGKLLTYYKLTARTGYSICHLPLILNTISTGVKEIFNENIVFENEKMTHTVYEQIWEKFVELTEFPTKGNLAIVCTDNSYTKNNKTYMYNSILLTDNVNEQDYTNTISPEEYTTALGTANEIKGGNE